MLRSSITALVLLLAAAGGLGAQSGEIGVSLTILDPVAFAPAPRASTVRYRAGEFVEVSMPLELAGSGSRIVAVAGPASGPDGSAFLVRDGSGAFRPLAAEQAVALGRSGKVGRSTPAEAVYRLDLKGKRPPRDLQLTVSYLIAPDA